MATIVRTPAASWKALVRKQGWPTVVKTFRTKRDAEDWARRTEDEIVRGVYIDRGSSERLMFMDAMDRYLREVTPTKKASTQEPERRHAEVLKAHFGKYSLAAINSEIVAAFRDLKLAEGKRSGGCSHQRPQVYADAAPIIESRNRREAEH